MKNSIEKACVYENASVSGGVKAKHRKDSNDRVLRGCIA